MNDKLVENILSFLKEPMRATFILSTLLSLVAILGVVVIGRDGAFYINIAQQVNENGIKVAFKYFSWPWFSILMAYTHKITGLAYETIAYFYSIGFMVGTSLLIVSIVKKYSPSAVWWAVLLVLSIPVFNSFRYDIIRDSGYWFFCILTLWVILKDVELTWLKGFLIQVSVLAAVLFRFEAFFLFPVIAFYVLFLNSGLAFKYRVIDFLKCFSVLILVVLLSLVFAIYGDLLNQPRIARQISLIDPTKIYTSFNQTSDILARTALRKWSYSDAPVILFFGMLFALLLRLFTYAGISSLLVFSKRARNSFFNSFYRYRLLAIAALAYFSILMIFFIQHKYINSRYSSLFILLIIPFLSVMAADFFKDKKRLAYIFIFISIVMSLSNVISISKRNYHYLEAAEWVEKNTNKKDGIYYSDARIQYYAGRGYSKYPDMSLENINDKKFLKYKYFVVESDSSKEKFISLIGSDKYLVVDVFYNGKKYVYIIKRI